MNSEQIQKPEKPELEKTRDLSLHTPDQTIEIVGSLDEALKSEDEGTVRKVIESFKNRESMIIRKGERGKNLELLKSSFIFLVNKEFGSLEGFLEAKNNDIIKWVHQTGLPENFLSDTMAVFVNIKDKKSELIFFKILSAIEENSHLLKDKNITFEAEHILATWEREAYDNKFSAERRNIAITNKTSDPFFANRARFGVSYNKELKPKVKAEEFEKISAIMEEIGDEHDSSQALAVAGEAYLSLAKRQEAIKSRESKGLAEVNFEKAKALIQKAFKKAKATDYPNSKIRAMKAFINLFEATGYSKKVDRWKSSLMKIEEDIGMKKEQ